ncbi:Glutathione S-transferase, N-terminal [Kalmanozyma brasiliensis GHG001]|uniref:Glutathione S-transferase n=1 Tax=Kalmanozyma brasiliensis (strain GHG001) TaxID=1365824 RepID=V5EQM2_KALBG|nr:Glutathione S-transferase, N-terminal [Kalmanozyma brasiliensis GHG001]EST07445.1 Glutathione S-transferase, N-terminal [Kalmanozyma brasiliensis GHG001]
MSDNSKKDGSSDWSNKDGHFRRQESSFRTSIEPNGKHAPEIGRYHLVVALACPWAHRALIVRQLKGMDKVPDLLPVHVVDSLLGPEGWSFVPYEGELKGLGVPGTGIKIPGHEDKKRIRELYMAADPKYEQRCTVPIIWDNKLGTIVNNESSEVIRNLNYAFDEFLPEEHKGVTYYPEELRNEIDAMNEWVYPTINNGVYKCGFATLQDAYESNVGPLFESLDRVEKQLSDGRKFLFGGKLTEADIRLFTTIVRFDCVYFTHFKCNYRTIRDGYPHINRWLLGLYWNDPAFKDTTDFDSIKAHYFQSHPNINPHRIVPQGPVPHILPLNK